MPAKQSSQKLNHYPITIQGLCHGSICMCIRGWSSWAIWNEQPLVMPRLGKWMDGDGNTFVEEGEGDDIRTYF